MPFRDAAADAALFDARARGRGRASAVTVDRPSGTSTIRCSRRPPTQLHALITNSTGATTEDDRPWTAPSHSSASAPPSRAGEAVIGAGAGTGISAKSAEAGGVDLIIIYNSGRYRMAGRGSLSRPARLRRRQPGRRGDEPGGAADRPRHPGARRRERHRPVPDHGALPRRPQDAWASPACRTFPTVGLFDGVFRQNLEETGMGYDLEVDMIRLAAERDLLTAPYVFDVESTVAMTEAGADVLVPHMGLTTAGTIGAHTALTLEESARAGAGDARRRRRDQPRRHRALPRRPDRRARGRRLRPRQHDGCRRVLRRIIRRASARPSAPSSARSKTSRPSRPADRPAPPTARPLDEEPHMTEHAITPATPAAAPTRSPPGSSTGAPSSGWSPRTSTRAPGSRSARSSSTPARATHRTSTRARRRSST